MRKVSTSGTGLSPNDPGPNDAGHFHESFEFGASPNDPGPNKTGRFPGGPRFNDGPNVCITGAGLSSPPMELEPIDNHGLQ